jgi:hypothetical protein
MTSDDMPERLVQQFKAAAAEGASLELHVRLLCGKVPTIAATSTAYKFEDVEDAVLAHFGEAITAEEREVFALTRQLRNKLLHADFRAARGKLSQLGGSSGGAGVRMLRIEPGREVEQLKELVAGSAGVAVGSTGSTAEGTVFGWLMEFGLSGEFLRAAESFRKALAIVERLLATT